MSRNIDIIAMALLLLAFAMYSQARKVITLELHSGFAPFPPNGRIVIAPPPHLMIPAPPPPFRISRD